VNPFSLCLLLAWAAEPAASPAVRLYDFSPRLAASIRGQSPDPFLAPSVPGETLPATPTLQAPVPMTTPETYNPFQPNVVQPYQQDPFLTPTDPFMVGSDPMQYSPGMMGPMYAGVNGPQPYRFGVMPRLDIGYIPESDIDDVDAGVEMFELDAELRNVMPFAQNWVFTSAPQFGYRAWNIGGGVADLGRINLYRFGWDLQLATPETYGWSWQFTFNPSINTDLESQGLTSNAWNLDGNVMAFYRVNPVWQFALGAGYWDRLDNIVIPYGGVIITPDDRWELRLMFPKSRISYFMALGLRSDHVYFDKYIEVAWVLGRNFEFQDVLPKLDVQDSVMVRAGIRF
jgi:hypothetical protein